MSNIADKISKLAAMADSTSNPEEADAFMSKVHEMLEQHGLSLLEIGKLQTDDPVGKTVDAGTFGASETTLRQVGFALARYYGCKAILISTYKTKSWVVFGRESARITFTLMWPYIKKNVMAQARHLSKTEGHSVAKQKRWVATALSARLNRLTVDREQQSTQSFTGVNALVPVDLIDEMCKVDYPNVSPMRSNKFETTKSAIDAAGNINLSEQLHSQKNKILKLK